MRLAWFTPWPPQASGVAGRSAELAPLLAARGHALDIYIDEREARGASQATPGPGDAGEIRVQSAHDFVWRQAHGQYDLVVYQMGNSRAHEFIWPYLLHWPGLVVLHDARLHHARSRALLRSGRPDDYRAEMARNHPDVSPDVAELAIYGFAGSYYYSWPMTRMVVESARLVASHSRGAAAELVADFPSHVVEYIALGEGVEPSGDVRATGGAFRTRHRIPADAVVFGVFGALTEDKRVPQILQAFAVTHAHVPNARLLLVGHPDPLLDLQQRIDALGLAPFTHLIDGATDADFDTAIAACDVSLNLRWPSALETSGPWLRALSFSRATVIVDLVHQGHVPALDPRTWRRHAPCEDIAPDADRKAVTVAIDILDEDHSLRLAMRRLATDADLRARLGRQARAYWEREHSVARMVDDYERAMAKAIKPPMTAPQRAS